MTTTSPPPADPDEGWGARAVTTLREAGHRRGGALVAVVEQLERALDSPTAEELLYRVRGAGSSCGRASVYRVLDLLTTHSLVERVEVTDGAARFVVSRGPRRHHMVCRACGGLMRFDDVEWSAAITDLSHRLGARIDEHHTLLQGECLSCGTDSSARACGRCG